MRRPLPMRAAAATVACTNLTVGVWSPDEWTGAAARERIDARATPR
jgi:hypothetical protein